MAKNLFGKMTSISKPYAIYRSGLGDHYILKTYKMAKNENTGFDRWMTFCNGDYGDAYKHDILQHGLLIHSTKEWFDTYHSGDADKMPKDLIISGELV